MGNHWLDGLLMTHEERRTWVENTTNERVLWEEQSNLVERINETITNGNSHKLGQGKERLSLELSHGVEGDEVGGQAWNVVSTW